MNKKESEKLIKQLQEAFILEEKGLVEFQFDCYGRLPENLNKEELERVQEILNTLLIQSLNHANIISDLIIELYHEHSSKKL